MDTTTTVLWWGRELFVTTDTGELARQTIPEKSDGISLFTSIIDALAPKPRAVRLIYQPSDLDVQPVQVPRGNRNLIKRTLCHEFPQIQNPATVWSCQKLRGHASGYSTLLFIESRPRLARLQTILRDRLIHLAGAWPLVTLLEQVPPTNNLDTSAIALVHTDERSLVFTVAKSGDPVSHLQDGADYHEHTVHQLTAATALFDPADQPRVLIVGDPKLWSPPDHAGVIAEPAITLAQLVAAAERIPAGDLSDFSVQDFTVNANLVLHFFSLGAAAAAAALAFFWWQDVQRYDHDLAKIDEARTTIAADIARLRRNKTDIERHDAFVHEITEDAAAKIALFRALVTDIPAAVDLRSLRIIQKNFVIEGTAREGIGQSTGPLYSFLDQFGAARNPWTITKESRPEKLLTPDFTITGSFK